MEATNEIGQIVKDIQMQTSKTIEKAKITEDILISQNQAVESTMNVFKNITNAMDGLVGCVEEIMSSIGEMEKSENDSLISIQNISAISEETAASVEEVTAATEEQLSGIEEMAMFANELSQVVKSLSVSIQRFKV